MISPFDTFGISWAAGTGGSSSTLSAISSLARSLVSIPADSSSASSAVAEIAGRGFSVWAVPTSVKLAETVSGTTGVPTVGQFRYRAGGPLGERDLGLLTGDTAAAGLPWSAMAFWDGTQFRGIVISAWTGRKLDSLGADAGALAVTSPASIFYPMTGDNVYRQVRPIVVGPDGAVVVNGSSTTTGYQFSSAQVPTANGYYSTSFFSADDGVWGIQPDARIDGDIPGTSLASGGYGFQNFNGSEPVYNIFWGGAAEASSTAVGIIFSA